MILRTELRVSSFREKSGNVAAQRKQKQRLVEEKMMKLTLLLCRTHSHNVLKCKHAKWKSHKREWIKQLPLLASCLPLSSPHPASVFTAATWNPYAWRYICMVSHSGLHYCTDSMLNAHILYLSQTMGRHKCILQNIITLSTHYGDTIHMYDDETNNITPAGVTHCEGWYRL